MARAVLQALFSTTFFTFSDAGTWEVSDKLWVYWATTVPATIVIVVLWRIWLANSDELLHLYAKTLVGAKNAWKRGKAGAGKKKSAGSGEA